MEQLNLKIVIGNIQEVPKGNEQGLYQFHSFNYIHCPNANNEEISREFNILNENGVLRPENMITPEKIEQISKYKSFNIVKSI